MSKYFYIIALFLISLFFYSSWQSPSVFAVTSNDASIVHLQIDNCNNDGICEPQFGENYQGCPLDCEAPTSTPPVPPVDNGGGVAPLTGGGSQNSSAINFQFLSIIVSSHSAIISWQTDNDAISLLSWGKTIDGELGTVSEINYGKTHRIEINNLVAMTRYFFKIESKNRNGNIFYLGPQGFITEAEISAPENIKDFRFNLSGQAVHLSWKNPKAKNFQSVRILRSEKFYADDPENGNIIYEGNGMSVDDRGVRAGGNYYYSAFAEDTDGNFSSGSLLHVRLKGQNISPPNPKPLPPKTISVPLEFYIEQNQKQISFTDNIAHVEPGQRIKISVSSENLPDDVQYLIINVEDENMAGTFHSYLFRHRKDTSLFEVILPAFTKEGKFSFSVSLLNSKQEEIGRFFGVFEVKKERVSIGQSLLSFWQAIIAWIIATFQKLLRIFGLY